MGTARIKGLLPAGASGFWGHVMTLTGLTAMRVARFSLFLLTLFVSTPAVFAEVTLLDNLNQRHGGPGPNFGFYFASCWGYVAPDGHEYALLGCYSGTSIIDLDVTPIAEVAFIPGENSEWKELKTWGHYAYAVSENSSQGIQIINLSQLPDTAWLVRSVFNVDGRNTSATHTVTVDDGFLYLNGGTSNGTVILDISDPENPTYAGEYQPEYLHDTYVKNDTLYGAAVYGGGVYMADVKNKSSIQQIGHITYPGSGTHNTWKSDFGSYVFTTDEIGSTEKNMKVFDISGAPQQLTPFTADPANIIHNVHGRGNYVYIAHYASGVFVADVHDPANITNAGGYDTYPGNGGYVGCWGVYPYFPSGRWIASDTQTGLYLFDFSAAVARTRSMLLVPMNGDTLLEGSPVEFSWQEIANPLEDPHYFKVHLYGPGVDTLLAAVDTTALFDPSTVLIPGETYSWYVWIKDQFTSVSSADTLQFVYGGPATGVKSGEEVPTAFVLSQNYPNPFNPETSIEYSIPSAGEVTLVVYDVLGRTVANVAGGVQSAGRHTIRFSGRNLPSGVYAYRIRFIADAGTGLVQSETRRMVLVR